MDNDQNTDATPSADPLTDFAADTPSVGGGFLDSINKELEAFNEPTTITDEAATPEAEATDAQDSAADASDEPAEKDDIDAIDPPEKASPAAKESFAKIKDSAKQYKTKFQEAEALYTKDIAERDAKIAELEALASKLPEFEEKAKFAEEAERELALSRVEGTREYKDTVLAPLDAIEAAALDMAKEYDIDADAVLNAIAERDPKRSRELLKEVVANVDDIDKLKLVRMAEDTKMLLDKRDTIRQRAFEARKELDEINKQNETKAQKKSREDFEAATSHAVGELKKRIPFVPLAKGETADSVFAQMLDKVKSTSYDDAPVATKAFAATAAVMLPRVTRQLEEVQKENVKLQARIKEGLVASPSVSGSEVAPAGGADSGFLKNIFGTLGMDYRDPHQ